MSRHAARLIGIAAVELALGSPAVYAGLLDVVPPAQRPADNGGGFLFLTLVIFALVGALIMWHRPSHTIGWVYAATGLLLSLAGPLTLYATIVKQLGDALPGAGIAGPASAVAYLTGFFLPMTYGLLLFPDGRLPSPRWRPVAWAIPVVFLALFTGAAQGNVGPAQTVGSFGIIAVTLASFASLFRRFRRSSGTERQQLKWAISAIGLLVAAAVIALLIALLGINDDLHISAGMLFFALTFYPLSVGIAILRYRLYDIDVLINRTLVYGATTAAIAATFFFGILALTQVLRPLTSGSELAIAASTLFSFALFQPVRRRVQKAVDRRFDRSRYDAARTLDAFADLLRDEVDLNAVRAHLLGSVQQTMAPSHASLWLRERAR